MGCAVGLAGVAGCGGEGGSEPAPREEQAARSEPRERRKPPRVALSRCAAGRSNCRSASGRVLYVEAVDPDGDGDAHFVLASAQSVTGPGLTVVDVAKDLRPRRLPKPGDLVSAAGPVYRGSYGQRQIEATELHVARRR